MLLVEDNLINQKVAQGMLAKLGYTLDVACNGRLGLEAILAGSYDVVFMDVQMPEMDGLSATRAVRANAEIRQPLLIAMTANAMQGDREMCLAAGMDDYIAKPIRVERLIEALLAVPAYQRDVS